MNKFYIILLISLILSSCASIDKNKEKTAAGEYKKAMKILEDKGYIEAAEKFEALYDDYPISKWSLKAQTIAAYAYYKEERHEDVIRVAETFIELNPASKHVSYLQYMKSISYFHLMPNVKRGQHYTKLASYNFRELVARFPYSRYIEDAKKKILVINENLAGAKMSIARYQMGRENYIGAIIHLNNVIYRYSKTNQSAEAYYRLYEIYNKLGMKGQANNIKNEMLDQHQDSDSIWIGYIKS